MTATIIQFPQPGQPAKVIGVGSDDDDGDGDGKLETLCKKPAAQCPCSEPCRWFLLARDAVQ